MAVIRRYQPQVAERIPNPTPARASQTSLGALGEGVDDLSDAAQEWQDEIDTAVAKEADARYADFIREQMYGENGFMHLDGSNAITQRRAVSEMMQKQFDDAFEGMTVGARAKAERALDARRIRALEGIDRHAVGQQKSYLNTAAEARIETAVADAIADPSSVGLAQRIIDAEMADYQERNGLPPEATALQRQQYTSAMHTAIVDKLLTSDPQAAAAYLDQHRDEIQGSQGLQRKVDQEAKRARGRALGTSIIQGVGVPLDHGTNVQFSMGPARPNAPDPVITGLIGKSIEDVLGPGATMIITSGQENPGDQHGSNRHRTGLAADVKILRPDGTVVKATDPEAALIAEAASKNGALGIGFGEEYMGGEHFHIDMVEPGAGQGHAWGSGGDAIEDMLVANMNGRQVSSAHPYAQVLQIEDPIERAFAIEEIRDNLALQKGIATAQQDQAIQTAFEIIETAGMSLNDLPDEFRTAIGLDGMKSLRAYERTLASGSSIQTDWGEYTRLQELSSDDPTAFLEENPAMWRDKLGDTEYKQLVDKRTQIREGRRTGSDDVSISSIRSTIQSMIKVDSMNDQDVVNLEGRLLAWENSFVAANDRMPTEVERREQAQTYLTKVFIDPKGMFNKQTTELANIDFTGSPVDPDDDITIETLRDGGLQLDIGGWIEIENDEIDAFVDMYQAMNGGAMPSAQLVVDGLTNLARRGMLR